MDSIERRKLKNKPKTATLQLITSAHVWKKVYTLSLFLLTLFFSHSIFSFYNQVWFFREEERCGGEEETDRGVGGVEDHRLLPIQTMTSLSAHQSELLYWGDWKV